MSEILAFISLVPVLEELRMLLILYSLITILYSLILYMGIHHGSVRGRARFIYVRPVYHTIIFGHVIPLVGLVGSINLFIYRSVRI